MWAGKSVSTYQINGRGVPRLNGMPMPTAREVPVFAVRPEMNGNDATTHRIPQSSKKTTGDDERSGDEEEDPMAYLKTKSSVRKHMRQLVETLCAVEDGDNL